MKTYPDFDENSDVWACDGGEASGHDGVQFWLGQFVDKRPHNYARLGLSTLLLNRHRVSKKLCKLIFCQNFVKSRPIVEIFGTKIAKSTRFSKVYSFATPPNLCRRTTVINTDFPNCYITQYRSKYDKVLRNNKFAQFFWDNGVVSSTFENWQSLILQK